MNTSSKDMLFGLRIFSVNSIKAYPSYVLSNKTAPYRNPNFYSEFDRYHIILSIRLIFMLMHTFRDNLM